MLGEPLPLSILVRRRPTELPCPLAMQPDAQKRRSRSGCTECRQRHRKCDEKKPACTGCERAGKQCTYTMRLSWGGRPFSKSRFGECMKSDPSLVQLPVVSSSGTYLTSDSSHYRLPTASSRLTLQRRSDLFYITPRSRSRLTLACPDGASPAGPHGRAEVIIIASFLAVPHPPSPSPLKVIYTIL